MGLFDFITSPVAAVAGGVLDYMGAQDANAQSAQNAANQQNFQLYMSNTAHQREVKDLEAAGLNPILSATGGNGASSPVGSNWSAVNTNTGLSAGLNSAARLASLDQPALKNQTEQTKSNINLQTMQAATEAEKQKNLAAQTSNTAADTANKLEQAKQIATATENIAQNTLESKARTLNYPLTGENIKADTAEKIERTQNYSFQRENLAADTALKLYMPKLYDAQIVQALSAASLNNATSALHYAQIPEISSRINNINASTGEINQRTANLGQQYSLVAPQVDASQGAFGGYRGYLSEWMKSITGGR